MKWRLGKETSAGTRDPGGIYDEDTGREIASMPGIPINGPPLEELLRCDYDHELQRRLLMGFVIAAAPETLFALHNIVRALERYKGGYSTLDDVMRQVPHAIGAMQKAVNWHAPYYEAIDAMAQRPAHATGFVPPKRRRS